MDHWKLYQALQQLDPQLIQEASQPVAHKKPRLRPVVLAACLILLIILPVMAVTGSLLVEHYIGEAIPDSLAEQDLDAFFRATTVEKVSITSLSQALLDTAAEQKEQTGYYSFDTWEDAEMFLGVNILDSDQIGSECSIPMMDKNGQTVLFDQCHLTLFNRRSGELYALSLNYFFQTADGVSVSLNANAVTDQNPNDNNSSLGVSNDFSTVLSQSSEQYVTTSGLQTTIVASQYSDGHGWSIDGWTQKNSFVLRFSLSTPDQESGMRAIRDLLDSIQ